MVDWLIQTVLPALRTSAQQWTAYKAQVLDGALGAVGGELPKFLTFSETPALVPMGVVARLRGLIQRITHSPGYTEAVGRDLGIERGETMQSLSVAKPTFKATAVPGHEVRLDWVKGRHTGVVVQGKREGDADWVALGISHYSPYMDGRSPLAAGKSERRDYRMRYSDKDEPIGEWSDTVSAVTSP